jgi:hypothetical protein
MINAYSKKILIMLSLIGMIILMQGCDSASDVVTGKSGGPCTGTGLTYKCQGRTCTLLATGTGVRCEGGQICLRPTSSSLPYCPS